MELMLFEWLDMDGIFGCICGIVVFGRYVCGIVVFLYLFDGI